MKRKSDAAGLADGHKCQKKSESLVTRAEVKPSLLAEDSDSEAGADGPDGGSAGHGFKINEEYAKRFEHNKKREEKSRLEEKYKHEVRRRVDQSSDDESGSGSSSDEEEDDDGFLATVDLDESITKTLQAIRNKDPMVYDTSATFYAPIPEEAPSAQAIPKEKPLHLVDYHRQNLLKGNTNFEAADEQAPPPTYQAQQADLKHSIVKEMHAAADHSEASDDDDDDFLRARPKPQVARQGTHALLSRPDVENADRDPETFLSNFMASRAWVPGESIQLQPFESDDEEADARAEEFELAYNLRFEDPKKANEKLKSYARDVVATKSVRKEELNPRKKQRLSERAKKDLEKQERDEERARLRKLKIEEMEEKLQKIKAAAGLSGKSLKDSDWSKLLDDGWDDKEWEVEMSKRFGEEYYAAGEGGDGPADGSASSSLGQKIKKPKWDDDIKIDDIVPDFEEEVLDHDQLYGSDDEQEFDEPGADGNAKRKSSKQHKIDRLKAKQTARADRRKIEALVDNQMDVDLPANIAKTNTTGFRYRDTSPTSFGLTAMDILMAPDAKLNEFAGLKKMASFRDPEKKRKDKKRLGKKARLRQWRQDTFGSEEVPGSFEVKTVETSSHDNGTQAIGPSPIANGDLPAEASDTRIPKKRKKRSRNKGTSTAEPTT